MVAEVDDVPEEGFQQWYQSKKMGVAAHRPAPGNEQAGMASARDGPLPMAEWAYGEKTGYQASRARAKEVKRRKDAAAMIAGTKEYPKLWMYEMLVVRAEEDNDDTGEVERFYELVQCLETVEENKRKTQKIQVQYMHQTVKGKVAGRNEFNGRFVPWVQKSTTKAKAGTAYVGHITREAIVVAAVKIAATGKLPKASKMLIADAQCGFAWDNDSKSLVYEPPAYAAASDEDPTDAPEGAEAEEEEEEASEEESEGEDMEESVGL
jgi:hypothetical protein